MLFDLNMHTYLHTYKIHVYTCMIHLKIKNKCTLKGIWKVDTIFIKGL